MFEAYIDDSATTNQEYFVLAGYIAHVDKWALIENEWQKLLEQDSKPLFKMNKFSRSNRGRAGCEKYYRIIEEHVDCAISILIRKSHLEKVVNETKPPANVIKWEKLKNPYYFALRALVHLININRESLGITSHIKFIFDEQAEQINIINTWREMYLSVTQDLRDKLDKEPTFTTDDQKAALQTADLWAWFVRRCAENGNIEPIKNLDFQTLGFNWAANRDILRAHLTFTEEDIRTEFARGIEFHQKRYEESLNVKNQI